MNEADLSFFSRLWMAFVCFWQILLRQNFAQAVKQPYDALRAGQDPRKALPSEQAAVPDKPAEKPKEPLRTPAEEHASGLAMLAMLQREGRLIDFLQEEVASFSDAEVGGAARVIHEGCRKVLKQYLTLEPVLKESEGAKVTVPVGFDANRIRLTGNVTGNPPFSATLKHHGWVATEVRLPKLSSGIDHRVIAAAEVEL